MKTVPEIFKTDIRTYGRQIDIKMKVNDVDFSSDNINYIKPSVNANLFKTIMQSIELDVSQTLAVDSKVDISIGIKVNQKTYNYVNLNSFYVFSCERQEDTNSYRIILYTKMKDAMIDYDLTINENITVRNYLITICEKLGWNTDNIPETFINSTKLVNPALHTNIGYTYRDALDEIATITCSSILFLGENLYLKYFNNTSETIDDTYLDEDNIILGNKYLINSLVFSRAEESDNIFKKDDDNIAINGLHEYRIEDNQLLSTNDRSDYIDEMFDYLKTLEFYVFDIQTKGILFLEPCDLFLLQFNEVKYPVLVLNDEISIEDGISESLYFDKPEETVTEYKYGDSTDKKINQLYILADKQAGKITMLSSSIEKAVIEVKVLYALSDSETIAPTTGWSETAPEWQSGKYMWQKTATTNGISTTYSEPTCIQGAKGQDGVNGKDGAKGSDGKSAYQIWLDAGNTGTEEDYLASLKGEQGIQGLQGLQGEKGEQGIPGTNGSNGQTSYLHIKYSNDGGKTFTSNSGETVGTYIGQYVDFTKADSTNVSDYTWAEIKGQKGDTGATGAKGEKGDTGTKGDTGIGVKSLEAQYYLSDSNTTQTGGNWKNTQDEWQSGKYYWTRSKITWTDDTVTYTEPELAEALNNANNVANDALNNTTVTNTTEEAKEFHLTDSADSNCKSAEIFGESKQETRSGKNLLNLEDKTETKNGVTVSVTNNKVVLNGTSTGYTEFYINIKPLVLNGSYSFSQKNVSGSISGNSGNTSLYNTVGGIQIMYPNKNSKKTYSSDTEVSLLRISSSSEITYDNYTYNLQLEQGEATEYEPYGASPSPEFPSEIESLSGKNIIPFPYYVSSTTLNGVEFTVNSDRSITANGIATADGAFAILARSSNPISLKAGKYTYSGVTNGSSSTWYLQMYKNSVAQTTNMLAPTTITAEDGDKINQISLFYKKGAVFNNVVIKPQLERGEKATFYVPSNYIGFKSTGKNLCDKVDYYDSDNKLFNMKSVKTINAWSGPFFDLRSICSKNNLKVGDTITMSIYFKTNFVPNRNMIFALYRATAASPNIRKTILASSVVVGEWQRLSFTINITEYSLAATTARIEADYYDLDDPYYFGNNRTNAIWFACPQLELGQEATEFEDLKESITAIPLLHDMRSLPNGTRDRIYYENGKWYDEQNVGQVVLNGSENWWYNSAWSGNYHAFCVQENTTIANNHNNMSNYFPQVNTLYHKDVCGIDITGGKAILIKTDVATNIDDWKTWLSTHKTEVLYELAEPIITEITDETTIQALESIKTYKGITNITADASSILTYYRDVPIVDEYETKIDANKKQEITIEKFGMQELTNEQFKVEIGKRVGKDEIISSINMSAESATIKSDKISLER